jgi:hypothetical protein
MHRSIHLIGCVCSRCASAVSAGVTPTGYSGRLNRTVADTDVRGFACLALNQPEKPKNQLSKVSLANNRTTQWVSLVRTVG